MIVSRAKLLTLAQAKYDALSGGTAGQALGYDGWQDVSVLSNVGKVHFNGVDYTVRTGTSGADGYITIGGNKIWIGETEATLALGENEVRQIYIGTTLAYTARTAITLFDRGWCENIMWQGNALPRPQYTSMAYASMDGVASGYMRMGVWNNNSSYRHYACVSTQAPVTIPAGATSMKVIVNATISKYIDLQFGVQPGDVKDVTSADERGQLTRKDEIRISSNTSEQEFTLTLNDTVKGKTNLYPVINCWRTADAHNELRIHKVWFE